MAMKQYLLSLVPYSPGCVDTEMGQMIGKSLKSPKDAAKTPIILPFEDVDGVTGRLWATVDNAIPVEGEVEG